MEDPGAESGTESEMIGRLPNSWGTGTVGDFGEDALGVGHRQTWRTQVDCLGVSPMDRVGLEDIQVTGPKGVAGSVLGSVNKL